MQADIIVKCVLISFVVSLEVVYIGALLAREGYPRQRRLLSKSYNPFIAGFVSFALPDTAAHYEAIVQNVLNGPAENAEALRKAISDECNITAITVRPIWPG